TDSRYLTDDMASGVCSIVSVSAAICDLSVPPAVQSKQVCDSRKVTDHHAIIPTAVAGKTDISVLPVGEREILTMISKQVLRA
ncbi:DNA topoisomerase III, partial [Streptococcus pyogenes]